MKKLATLTIFAALLTACGAPPSGSATGNTETEKQYKNPSGNWVFNMYDGNYNGKDMYFDFYLPISDNDSSGKFKGKNILEITGYTHSGATLSGDFIGSYTKSTSFDYPATVEIYQKLPTTKPDGTAYELCYANNSQYSAKFIITGKFLEKDFYGNVELQMCSGGSFRGEHNVKRITGTKK